MVPSERPSGTLPVNAAGAGGTVNVVLLYLGDVVADIVDQVQPAVPAVLLAQHLSKPLGQC